MQIRLTRVVVSFATPSREPHGAKMESDVEASTAHGRVVTFESPAKDASQSAEVEAPAVEANDAESAAVTSLAEDAKPSTEAPADEVNAAEPAVVTSPAEE